MNSEHAATEKTPSISTLDLDRKRDSRRGSIGSSAGVSQLDRDTFAQTLDQINQHASRSDSLTTFNEYTSPPSSSLGGETKGLAGELQGGLSGFYKKVRASVGNVRDIVIHTGEQGALDETPLRSSKLVSPTSAPIARSKPNTFLSPNDLAVSVTQDTGNLPDVHAKESNESSKSASQGRNGKPTKLVLGGIIAPTKPSLTPNLPLRSPLAPLALPTTVVSPAIAEASVSDSKDDHRSVQATISTKGGLSSRAEEQLYETVNKQKGSAFLAEMPSALASEARKEDYSQTIIDQTTEAAQRWKERPIRHSIEARQRYESSQTQDLDYFTPTKPPLEPPKIVTHAGTPQKDSLRTPQGTRLSKEELLDTPIVDALDKTPIQGTGPITPDMMSPVSVQGQQPFDHRRDGTSSLGPTVPSTRIPSSKEQNFVNISQSTLPQSRNRVLDKEYWMKDENARDCFYCGDPFSTFRRKHHCSECSAISYIPPLLSSVKSLMGRARMSQDICRFQRSSIFRS